ncbi:uncharacterized protein LOC117897249 [Drosophila subobscura]|uniref:uncharacterized protein LOC117897249 n=1 Tax=Drosophila subobscura TaxID=7241 RepID=UPI00155AFBAA|nr:uncharacterized protein LOC117897249 [Drosophila subobscura]
MGKKNKKQATTEAAEPVQPVADVDAQIAKRPRQQSLDRSLEVFLWLLAYSFLMFTLPFLGFYGVQSWLKESFPTLTIFEVNCYSVLTAVLVVNAVVALYVLKAFREKDPPTLEEVEEAEAEQKKSQ